ncbi:hypothetical protein JCM8097_004319 [Rhodosporidiobolus ruineniae]
MVHIFLRTRLTPPTLLPFLHDLYHHQTPRWFAELEAVYRAVDNLDDLLDEALHQEVTLDKLNLYWRFRWSRLQEDLSIEQWRRNGYLLNWYPLGITVPATSSELPPPYPETRPLALRTCPLLRLVDARAANHREEQLRTTWEGPVDEEIRNGALSLLETVGTV